MKAIIGWAKFFNEVNSNEKLTYWDTLKLDNAIPKEIKTAGKANIANKSKTKPSVFGGLIDEKFSVIPINIPKRTIFLNKP